MGTPNIADNIKNFNEVFPVFRALFSEMSELSKKKPDQTLSPKKVEILNKVLIDLKEILSDQPQSKYLEILDDVALPINSDVVLIMSQFKAIAFESKLFR